MIKIGTKYYDEDDLHEVLSPRIRQYEEVELSPEQLAEAKELGSAKN